MHCATVPYADMTSYLNPSPYQTLTPHAVNIGVAGDMMMKEASAPAAKIFCFQHQKI